MHMNYDISIYIFVHVPTDCIGGVMFGVLALSAVDHGYQSNQRL